MFPIRTERDITEGGGCAPSRTQVLPAPLVAVQSCGWDVNFPFRTAAFLQIGFQDDGLHVITPLRMLFCLKVMMRHIRAIRCLSRVFMNMKKWIIDDSFKKVQYRLPFLIKCLYL